MKNSPISQKEATPLQHKQSSIMLAIYVLIAALLGIITWASLAPLDEGVPTQGAISIDMKRKNIQHLSGGIITTLLIKEGQWVKAGEILLTIDSAINLARFKETQEKYINDRIVEARLDAEIKNMSVMTQHADIQAMIDDPLVKLQINNQQNLLSSRRQSLEASIQENNELIKSNESQIKGFQSIQKNSRFHIETFTKQLKDIKPLVAEGYVPRIQQEDLELKISQARSDFNEAESNINKTDRAINEVKQRIHYIKEEYNKEVSTKLSEIRSEVNANANKLKALSDELERTTITSPVEGQVVDLQFHSVGAVIQPSQKILSVVPKNEFLIIEAKIASHLIDKVHPGLLADVRFSNFVNTPQLMVEGKVDSVSTDLISEPGANPLLPLSSYYLARIKITEKGIKTLNNRNLESGMPVQVVIKTGERSLMKYLMHPFFKRFASSLKEE
jgi:protease secretion system membrane fusion protein